MADLRRWPLPQNILSYTASQQPAPPMRDPYDAFTRLFSDIGLDAAGTTAASARSKKTRMVLDAANAEFTNLNKTASLSMDDRRRLDEHLAQIEAGSPRVSTRWGLCRWGKRVPSRW